MRKRGAGGGKGKRQRDEHVSDFRETRGNRKQGHHLRGEVTAGGCLAALPTLCLLSLKQSNRLKLPSPPLKRGSRAFVKGEPRNACVVPHTASFLYLALLCSGMTRGQRNTPRGLFRNVTQTFHKQRTVLLPLQGENLIKGLNLIQTLNKFHSNLKDCGKRSILIQPVVSQVLVWVLLL